MADVTVTALKRLLHLGKIVEVGEDLTLDEQHVESLVEEGSVEVAEKSRRGRRATA